MLHVSHWIFATLLRIAPESSSKNMVTEKMVLGRQVSAQDTGPARARRLSARGGLNPGLTQHQTTAQLWVCVGAAGAAPLLLGEKMTQVLARLKG